MFIYFFLPQPEHKILQPKLDESIRGLTFYLPVILQSNRKKSEPVEKMENISQAFKIILNADSHMEHADTSNRKDFNYAVVSRGLTKAEDKNAFMENLEQKNFIVKKEVFHYKTNPARAHLINFIIKIKAMFVSDQLTPKADKKLPDM